MGLEQINTLLNYLDNPEKSLKFIHVAGTNGKGSVCSILATALKGAGYKVGFYSSPHLISLRERFRINGKGISEKELSELVDHTWPAVEKMYSEDNSPTFFEVTVSMAALYFAKKKCDFVLWETGLGGRLDSTNAVSPIITAITGIGLDHEKYLGDTEEKIAVEKAGIIKRKVPVFVGKMSTAALQTVKKVATKKAAPFFVIDEKTLSFKKANNGDLISGGHFFRDNKSYYFPLSGDAQRNNMRLAYCMLEFLSNKFSFRLETALENLKNLKWYGRLQQLPDGKILDGAHNSQGITSLVKTLQDSFGREKFVIVFGCLEERNPEKAISILSQIAKRFIFIPINSSRPCLHPKKILETAKNLKTHVPCSALNSLKEALNAEDVRNNKKVLITGSLYLAGETLLEYYSKEEIINI